MKLLLLAYGHDKETITATIMLYRNTKVKVRSTDGCTDFFDVVAGVLQRDTLVPCRFLICLELNVRRT